MVAHPKPGTHSGGGSGECVQQWRGILDSMLLDGRIIRGRYPDLLRGDCSNSSKKRVPIWRFRNKLYLGHDISVIDSLPVTLY